MASIIHRSLNGVRPRPAARHAAASVVAASRLGPVAGHGVHPRRQGLTVCSYSYKCTCAHAHSPYPPPWPDSASPFQLHSCRRRHGRQAAAYSFTLPSFSAQLRPSQLSGCGFVRDETHETTGSHPLPLICTKVRARAAELTRERERVSKRQARYCTIQVLPILSTSKVRAVEETRERVPGRQRLVFHYNTRVLIEILCIIEILCNIKPFCLSAVEASKGASARPCCPATPGATSSPTRCPPRSSGAGWPRQGPPDVRSRHHLNLRTFEVYQWDNSTDRKMNIRDHS